jgi:L-amino acid N-acyltransferase YncA
MQGFTIREATPADAAAIARVHIDSSRATYRGLVPDEVLYEMTYERRLGNWSETLGAAGGAEFVYVAGDEGGRVFGFASGGPEREGDAEFDGELYAIYLLGTHRRGGAGRALAAAVAARLDASGFRSMLVWVLAENPACRFYEALGGARVREKTIERGGRSLSEIGYGWRDVKTLRDGLRTDA